jgi:multiple sugar transport system substrate-binding protein
MKPILEAYEQSHPGVKLEYVELSESEDSVAAMKKLDLLAASGEDIDVVFMPGATDYSQRAGLGLLAPLNDLIQQEGIILTDEYVVDPSVDGKVYALPDTLENYFVLLNKDMLDQAGLKVPTEWTWDQYLDYADKLTSGSGAAKVYGTYFHTWPMYWQLALINQEKDNNLVNKGTVHVDSPEIRQSLELRSKAEENKVAVPYTDTISQKLAYRSEFFSKHAAMIVTGNWMIGEVGGSDEFPATFTTAFAPMPSNAAGQESGISIANGNYVGIMDKSKHQPEAYNFIRWYSTEGEQLQNVYSAWKKQDTDKFIAAVKANAKSPDKIDGDSLAFVIKNAKAAPLNVPPTYQAELEEAFTKETELYILKKQDLETTIQKGQAELQKIVDANK